jgi:hypothetical protein
MDRLSVAHSLAMLVQTSDPYVAVRAKDRFGQVDRRADAEKL